jgi:hypothetical protein
LDIGSGALLLAGLISNTQSLECFRVLKSRAKFITDRNVTIIYSYFSNTAAQMGIGPRWRQAAKRVYTQGRECLFGRLRNSESVQNDACARDQKTLREKRKRTNNAESRARAKPKRAKNTGVLNVDSEKPKSMKEISGNGANFGRTAIDSLPRR